MYSAIVLGVPREPFEEFLTARRAEKGAASDADLTAEDLRWVVQRYEELVRKHTGAPFPDDPREQLWGAIGAVFRSWDNDRAKEYRRLYRIPEDWGTAVNVQAMVFGNRGDSSATGVAFTRNPATGEKRFYGEFLPNAQGEDVVAGIRTPRPLASDGSGTSLEETMPPAYAGLLAVRDLVEKSFRDMQDLEFTIEEERLYILQTRNGKRTGSQRCGSRRRWSPRLDRRERSGPPGRARTARPASRSAVPARREEVCDQGRRLLRRGFRPDRGSLRPRVTAKRASRWPEGRPVVLVRSTSPEDIAGMNAAAES